MTAPIDYIRKKYQQAMHLAADWAGRRFDRVQSDFHQRAFARRLLANFCDGAYRSGMIASVAGCSQSRIKQILRDPLDEEGERCLKRLLEMEP